MALEQNHFPGVQVAVPADGRAGYKPLRRFREQGKEAGLIASQAIDRQIRVARFQGQERIPGPVGSGAFQKQHGFGRDSRMVDDFAIGVDNPDKGRGRPGGKGDMARDIRAGEGGMGRVHPVFREACQLGGIALQLLLALLPGGEAVNGSIDQSKCQKDNQDGG